MSFIDFLKTLIESYDFRDGVNEIKKKYKELERLNVIIDEDTMITEIKLIRINKDAQNQGIGSKVMKDLTDLADEHDMVLSLTPEGSFGVSKSVLVKFYKKFGFVDNSGKNKYYEAEGTMIRQPKF